MFFFFSIGCLIKTKEPSQLNYFPLARENRWIHAFPNCISVRYLSNLPQGHFNIGSHAQIETCV